MAYFDKRPPQAERDANFALEWVKQHATTSEQQQAVVDTLDVQVRCTMEHDGCAALCLCHARADPSWRIRAEKFRCLSQHRIGRVAPGVRLHFDKTRDAWVLLGPERVIETEGPASDILRRCDGTRTF